MAQQQFINIGSAPNDQQGDPLRTAFGKINDNFSNLFATAVSTSIANTTGNTAGQVIFETPANTFTTGQFNVQTTNPLTNDSQSIQLSAQVNAAGDEVKFTGFGTSFTGPALTNYDMDIDVLTGNVRLMVNPLINEDLTHFIASQINLTGAV